MERYNRFGDLYHHDHQLDNLSFEIGKVEIEFLYGD